MAKINKKEALQAYEDLIHIYNRRFGKQVV